MPPKRLPTRPPTAERDEPETVEELREEDLEAEEERLQQLVNERRRRSRITALRAKLAGETPEPETESHKRGLSVSSSTVSQMKRVHIRAKEPTIYEGKSLREYREYAATCKTYFTAVGGEEPERIELAATYLRGNALSIWVVKDDKPDTWEGFLKWAKSLVADPANRMADASLRLKNLVQRDTQSVREVATMMKELEEDLLTLTPSEKRAWRMLNTLRPKIRREVLRENKVITSREQVIMAAQRQEELLKQERDARSSQKGQQGASVRDAREKHLPPEEKLCYTCRKPGHIAKNYPTGVTGETPAKHK